jgi:hypothetical protein
MVCRLPATLLIRQRGSRGIASVPHLHQCTVTLHSDTLTRQHPTNTLADTDVHNTVMQIGKLPAVAISMILTLPILFMQIRCRR